MQRTMSTPTWRCATWTFTRRDQARQLHRRTVRVLVTPWVASESGPRYRPLPLLVPATEPNLESHTCEAQYGSMILGRSL